MMKAVAVCAALMATTVADGVRAELQPTLTVRLYNTAGIPLPELLAA